MVFDDYESISTDSGFFVGIGERLDFCIKIVLGSKYQGTCTKMPV